MPSMVPRDHGGPAGEEGPGRAATPVASSAAVQDSGGVPGRGRGARSDGRHPTYPTLEAPSGFELLLAGTADLLEAGIATASMR